MAQLPIFIDIDGTLTSADVRGGKPIDKRIESVKHMIEQGTPVVLWSANGTDYVKKFADTHGIHPLVCIGKPSLIIDDNPTIRPNFLGLVKNPSMLDKE